MGPPAGSVPASPHLSTNAEENNEVTSALCCQHSLNNICNELHLQKQRNLVLFGLQESNNDLEVTEALVQDVGVVANISAVNRVGGGVVENRPRTLVVKFATEQDQDGIYNNLRNLKGKLRWNRISVVPDLTKIQYQDEKAKYKELLEEKKKKENENTGNGVWKIVGVRGKKKLVYIIV